MSAVVKLVEKAFKVVEKVGKVVTTVVAKVGKVVEQVGKIAKAVVENYGVQLALMAAGVPPWAAAAANTLARGGSMEDALKSAALNQLGAKINASVYNQAIAKGFTVAEATAAASAASSAATTAAVGGDVKSILKSAAIGGISATAATKINQTYKNPALTAFVRDSTAATLRGASLKEALVAGGGSAAVAYMDKIQKEEEVKAKRAEAIKTVVSDYKAAVDEYNKVAKLYNASTSQAEADKYKAQLNDLAADIKSYEKQINAFNKADAASVKKIQDLTDKAVKEAEKTGYDISKASDKELAKIEADNLAAEEAKREAELLKTIEKEITPEDKVLPGDETDSFRVDDDFNIVDKETGEVVGVVAEDKRGTPETDTGRTEVDVTVGGVTYPDTPVSAGVDLREYGSGKPGTGSAIVGGGGYSEQEASILPFTFIGQDEATGLEQYDIGGDVFTLVVLPNEEKQLVREDDNVVFDVTIDKDNKVNVIEAPGQEPPPVEPTPVEPTPVEPEKKPIAPAVPGGGGGGGGSPSDKEILDLISTPTTPVTPVTPVTPKEPTPVNPVTGEPSEPTEPVDAVFDWDREISDLEAEISQLETDEDIADLRNRFVGRLKSKLREGEEDLPENVSNELDRILNDYTKNRGGGTAEDTTEKPVGEGEVDDSEIMDLISGGGTGEPGEQPTTGRGEGEGTGTGAGVGAGTGGGEGTGEGEGEGAGVGEGEGTGADTGYVKTVTISPKLKGNVSTISPRASGEALASILGQKEPTFGGDEDMQREVWNRRSLRLRKALGL